MTHGRLMGPPRTTTHANASIFDAFEASSCFFAAWSPRLSVAIDSGEERASGARNGARA
jgi:hypothetical protein